MRTPHHGHGRPAAGLVVACALACVLVVPAHAAPHAPTTARAGLDLARAAAAAWAPDAELVYLENDETPGTDGTAARWGYLFHSPGRDASRAWSVRDGRIVAAEDLPLRFEAPPLADGWIDSAQAVAAAAGALQRETKGRAGGAPTTVLLMRGAFQDGEPDASAWTVVYDVPGGAPLSVMVDARDGRVLRTWRG